jgi:N4-gp56 family major capsid protein
MAIQTTSNLSSSIRTLYSGRYLRGAQRQRLYDQLAAPVGQVGVEKSARLGNTLQVNFLSALTPGVTAISETTDVTPQTFREATTTVSPTSRGEAIQFSEELTMDVFTDFTAAAYEAVGENQMESVEVLAIASALAGGLKLSPAGTARASLDAGTTHCLTEAAMGEAEVFLRSLKCPGFVEGSTSSWFAIMHPANFHDVRRQGNVVSIAQYQQGNIILSSELGRLGAFRFIVSPFAKVFGGAGIDNATNVATTLAAAANKLAVTIEVADATGITTGDWLTIGTEETANTFYPTNERVRVSGAYVSGTTIDIIGEGPNGGLRYDHDSGAAVRNADSVYPVVYGGPMSMAKLYDSATGEFGTTVGPKTTGLLDQFNSLGWKFFGGYGRWVESWIIRGEYSTNLEA